MKNTLLALALFAFAGTSAFAHETPGKTAKGKKATCPAMAAAQCTRMASGNTAGMPACCRAKMAKMAAASAATAQVKTAPVTKTM